MRAARTTATCECGKPATCTLGQREGFAPACDACYDDIMQVNGDGDVS